MLRSAFASASLTSLLLLSGCASSDAPTTDYTYLNIGTSKPPSTAEGYSDFLVGRYASLTNDPRVAATNYASASRREPSDRIILERAIFSLLLSGDVDGARNLIRSAPADIESASSLSNLTKGVDLIRQGRATSALTHLTKNDFGPFNRAVARGIAAWISAENGDLVRAERLMTEQPTGDSLLDGVNSYMLGILFLSHGEEERALHTFERAWFDGTRLAIGIESYVRLLASRGETQAAATILQEFRTEVGANPALDALFDALAVGVPIEPKTFTMAEGAALAIYAPAAALAAQTQNDLAGVYFVLALELDPDLHIARTMLGDALELGGRREDALAVLETVPRTSPFFASARAQMAWTLRRLERNQDAVDVASDALEAKPNRDLRIQLGDLFRSLGNYERAEALFDEIVTADEAEGRSDWRLYYARGVARENLDRWPDAERDLQRALALEPDQPQVLNYLGYSWVDRGENLTEAFQLIQRAVELRPNSGYIVDSLGWAYYRLGRYDEAVIHLERAVELDPHDPTLNDHLGDAYWQVGRRLEATFQWRHALKLNPTADDAELIQAKLETGLAPSSTQTVHQQYDVPDGELLPASDSSNGP